MANRTFTVTITSGNAPGPYAVYYNEINELNYATLVQGGGDASTLTLTQLESGVDVEIPDTSTSIILNNETPGCDNSESFPLTPVTTTSTSTTTPPTTSTSTTTSGLTQYDLDIYVHYEGTCGGFNGLGGSLLVNGDEISISDYTCPIFNYGDSFNSGTEITINATLVVYYLIGNAENPVYTYQINEGTVENGGQIPMFELTDNTRVDIYVNYV